MENGCDVLISSHSHQDPRMAVMCSYFHTLTRILAAAVLNLLELLDALKMTSEDVVSINEPSTFYWLLTDPQCDLFIMISLKSRYNVLLLIANMMCVLLVSSLFILISKYTRLKDLHC